MSLFYQPDKKGHELPYEDKALDPPCAFCFDKSRDRGGPNLVKVIDPFHENDIPEKQGNAAANRDARSPFLCEGCHPCDVLLDERAERSGGPEDQFGPSKSSLGRVVWSRDELIGSHG
jgi:hypothetical protein